ncbi:MAG: ABC transporter permease [Desulfuromonas sp.]|nr:MAG: ABC transporter permease [Desulfuromonas sp.]
MNEAFRRRIKRNDRLAKWFITFGGLAIIFCVILILLLIVNVSLPLFQTPEAKLVAAKPLSVKLRPDEVLAVGVDDYLENAFAIDTQGRFHFIPLGDDPTQLSSTLTPAYLSGQLRAVEPFGRQLYGLLWEDGTSSIVKVAFTPFFDEAQNNKRTIRYRLEDVATFDAVADDDSNGMVLMRYPEEGGRSRVDLLKDQRVLIRQVAVSESLFGDAEEELFESEVLAEQAGPISAMVLDQAGQNLYLGTGKGFLLRYDLSEPGEPELIDKVRVNGDERAITALNLVFGDYSLAIGDAQGRLSTWSPVRDAHDPTRFVMTRLHQLTPHPGAVTDIRPSLRDKSLLSYSVEGGLHLDHMTSERHLLEVAAGASLRRFALSTRSNGLVTFAEDMQLRTWKIINPHPEVSLKTLFGKVWYEGYDEPVYAWQSSSASDDFEPKLSLTPLIFGTLKGTFYAMIFAVPLALFGAIYTSQFCRPRVRGWIKPMVEIMAAVPTVIIGFLAALWLAPLIEASLGAVFLSVILVPAGIMVGIIVWQGLRQHDQLKPIERGYEFLAVAPIIVIAVAAAFSFGPSFEALFFGGDLKQWIFQNLDTRYDPRNCIVIAFAMGFAVIPIIFTIAEDSLSNVPPSLKAASLACGASRWQTVWRVILPSASPGIFAGTMIGFGRAVGETMIVLMATGNTAIMELTMFNGMRPLSSNIAVEIPEAPHGGTLYRVLFLSAVLLFVMTFIVNTAAEVIRQRLRAKYGRF